MQQSLGLEYIATTWYKLDIEPETSPRPRSKIINGKIHVFMPAEYEKYKKQLIKAIEKLEIQKAAYSQLEIVCYFPYPKSTPKKRLIEGDKMRVKPDVDNVWKGVSDALEQAKVLINDSGISDGLCRKRYTTLSKGWIEFRLIL